MYRGWQEDWEFVKKKKYLYNLMDIDMVKQEVIKTWLTKAKLTYLQV